MAAVEVTISGVLYDKHARTTRPVVIIGEASLTGPGVGGGPIIPPDPGQPGDPPGIWGPGDPRPQPPIELPPGGGGRPGDIVPPMPGQPPQQPDQPKPPENGWAWHPAYGWGYFPPHQAVPKRGPQAGAPAPSYPQQAQHQPPRPPGS